MRAHLGLAAALPCAPLLLWQGRRVRRDTPKLPEAEGPRDGIAGADRPGRPLRLLIVGDSSAAGVGASVQDEALAGRLVGRVEHVVSGRATRFRSLRQLVEFMDGATAMAERRSPGVASGTTPRAKRAPRRGS